MQESRLRYSVLDKKLQVALTLLLAVACTGCGVQRANTRAEKLIPGTYNYEHSWDYKAPDGNGTIHCDETGTLRFFADGTCVDDAIQFHHLKMDTAIVIPLLTGEMDTIAGAGFNYGYHCKGRWRVEEGKFLFNEMSEDFSMLSINNTIWSWWWLEYSASIVSHSWPNSDRWFTFDIERLDEEWFIWSYTYPNGRKDTWEMHRVKPNEANFGRL